MFNKTVFIKILKFSTENGYKNLYRKFSVSSKLLSSESDVNNKYAENVQVQSVKMAFNMFSRTESVNDTPLIIMHGLFGSKQNWRTIGKVLQKKLSPNRPIFTVDARNHGESMHSPDHTYDHLAADVLAFLKEQNIKKAILMGHSMGGRAMMNFALKYPDLVEKLIVVDISPVNRSQSLEGMESLIKTMKNIDIPSEVQMRDARKLAMEQLSAVTDNGTAEFILLNLKKLADGSIVWTLNLNALENNLIYIRKFPEIMKKYMGPTLFIAGTKSDFVAKDDLEKIKQWFPNATLEWLDAGHVIHFEKPNEFINLLIKFLNN